MHRARNVRLLFAGFSLSLGYIQKHVVSVQAVNEYTAAKFRGRVLKRGIF